VTNLYRNSDFKTQLPAMDCYSVPSVILLLLSIITVNGDAEVGSNLCMYYLD
jgi:hypothetical protein